MAQISPRAVFIIVIFLVFFLHPLRPVPSSRQRDQISAAVAASWGALDQLNASSFGDFVPWDQPDNSDSNNSKSGYLNITGFRKDDGFSWSLLPAVQERARAQVRYQIGAEGMEALEAQSDASFAQYSNITSWLRGEWIRSPAELKNKPGPINLTHLSPDTRWSRSTWERNITGHSGDLWLHLSEQDDVATRGKRRGSMNKVQGLSAVLSLRDQTSTAGGWDFPLRGVHFAATGTTVFSTGSVKYAGVYGLPHMALSEQGYIAMQRELNETLPTAIRRKAVEMGKARDLEPTLEVPGCELVMYMQQEPIPLWSPADVNRVEHELRHLDGPAFGTVPPLRTSLVMFSPDCGYILESKGPPDHPPAISSHISGQPIARYTDAVRQALLGAIMLLSVQIYLLIRQMKMSSTPARQSRMSTTTISMMALGDGFVWISLMFAAPLTLELGLILLAAGFTAFLGGSLFPMRLLMDVWNAQEPERIEQAREVEAARLEARTANQNSATSGEPREAAPASVTAATSNGPVEGGLPMPVTAVRFNDTGATPLSLLGTSAVPTQQPLTITVPPSTAAIDSPISQRTTFGSIYTRLMLALLTIIFLTIHALTSFTTTFLGLYLRLISFLYLSLWVPQIMRNLKRNISHAFLPSFVVGQSMLRLAPFVYLWGYTGNVLFADPDRLWLCVLGGWLWTQCVALAAQETLGAQFCVTDKGLAGRFWARMGIKEAWDWHPVLRADEEGATLPVGVEPDSPVDSRGRKASIDQSLVGGSGSGSDARKAGTRTYECAICMQKLHIPVLDSGDDSAGRAGMLERRKYMVTPCRHVFHTQCLEAWIGMRLQCPICREALPPV